MSILIDRQGAPYVLIEGGSFVSSVKKKQWTVPDLHIARYTVTNQLYRRFIAYLDGSEAHFACILPLERFKEHLSIMAQGVGGFRRYLKGEENLATLFRSRLDDDRKFNMEEQPVVGVSWYAARAYCCRCLKAMGETLAFIVYQRRWSGNMRQAAKRTGAIRGVKMGQHQREPITVTTKVSQLLLVVILKDQHRKDCMTWPVMCGSGWRITMVLE